MVCEGLFFDIQKYIDSESGFNTPYTDIKHKCLKKFLSKN